MEAMEEMQVVTETAEQEIEARGASMLASARALKIATAEEYEYAGRYLGEIKAQIKRVKEYWAEPKAAAQAMHKRIVEREKAMLNPLSAAETALKGAMMRYQEAVEAERRKAEEEARRRQREEAEALMQQAVSEMMAGRDEVASVLAQESRSVAAAEIAPAAQEAPRAAGTYVRKAWKARVIDAKLVPAYYDGYEVREISMAKLNLIARMSEGTAQIPGVELYQESTLAARG